MNDIATLIGVIAIVAYISASLGYCDFKVCLGAAGTCQMIRTEGKKP